MSIEPPKVRRRKRGASPRAASAGQPSGRSGPWRPPEGTLIALTGLLPIFAAHYMYAALYSETAFTLVVAEGLVLIALLFRTQFRNDLLKMRGLVVPGVLFTLVLMVGLIQLTPWAPGGPHPIWAYVGRGPGSTTIDRSATTAELIKLMGLASIFLVGALTGASDRRARTAINVAIALGVVLALWAFFGDVTGTVYQTQGRRLEGHFLNPNTAGTFMGCMLILSLSVLFRQLRMGGPAQDRISRAVPMGSLALLFGICLVMTASRGGAAALLASLIAFGMLQLFSSKVTISRALIVGLASLVVGAGAVLVAGDMIIDRLASTDQDVISRTAIWSEHWKAFLSSPLLGYGLGTSEAVNKTLITTANYADLWKIKAILNVYLQWLEQAGLIGAALMFACIGAILFTTVTGAFARSRMTLILFGLISVDVLFLSHGITDFALDAFSMAAMWSYLLGLQMALSQGSTR